MPADRQDQGLLQFADILEQELDDVQARRTAADAAYNVSGPAAAAAPGAMPAAAETDALRRLADFLLAMADEDLDPLRRTAARPGQEVAPAQPGTAAQRAREEMLHDLEEEARRRWRQTRPPEVAAVAPARPAPPSDGVALQEWKESRREVLYQALRRLWMHEAPRLEPPSTGGAARLRNEDDRLKQQREAALRLGLVGLAFSGGGIRSATFNLGILQGLAHYNLLRIFDFLSTVSGGGYIGSWLAAWIKREGDLRNVEQQLKPNRIDHAVARRHIGGAPVSHGIVFDEEPGPVYHLRAHSSYLTPRHGIMSVDSWSLFGHYVRNLLYAQLLLLPTSFLLVSFFWMMAGIVRAVSNWPRVQGLVAHVPDWLWNIGATVWPSAELGVILAPPLLLAIVVMIVMLVVGWWGNRFSQVRQENIVRVLSWILLMGVAWLALAALALSGHYLFTLHQSHPQIFAWIAAVGSSSWAATTVGGIWAAAGANTNSRKPSRFLNALALIAPWVFLFGLLAGISWLVAQLSRSWLLYRLLGKVYSDAPTADPLFYWSAVALLMTVAMLWIMDANYFSMHAAYTNRLVRCYLGASRPKERWTSWFAGIAGLKGGAPTASDAPVRPDNPFSGFDLGDDFFLQHLTPDVPPPGTPKEHPYRGPVVIINTALNLVSGQEMAWQERKADSFMLTARALGSRSTHWRRLPKDNNRLSLGRAMGISGAAMSPNMGYHSSPSVTALMSVFNVRLGAWLKNPAKDESPWTLSGRPSGIRYLMELFSQTNERDDWVYLSDGGHFENLGVYELIRRRCRFILACDAGADPHFEFLDLAGLIRKVRNDFGIRIDIDVGPLRPQGAPPRSTWHCSVGVIRYDDVDPDAPWGILVYVKTSLTGDEPTDVVNYASAHPSFPHEPTSDQSFNESQFESYRALGFHVVQKIMESAVGDITNANTLPAADLARALFLNLETRWLPPPHGFIDRFLDTTRPYLDVLEALRTDDNLRTVSSRMYPALDGEISAAVAALPPGAARTEVVNRLTAEFHLAFQMMQILENAWIVLDLDQNIHHPLNRGWKKVFQLWLQNPAVAKHRAIMEPEFAESFVRFLHRVF